MMEKMLRRVKETKVQGKKGFYIESSFRDSKNDYNILKESGFYVYGVRYGDNGKLWTIEDNLCFVNHGGYMVFTRPIKFPVHKNNLYKDSYYCLNNQYSYIDYYERDIDLLKVLTRIEKIKRVNNIRLSNWYYK